MNVDAVVPGVTARVMPPDTFATPVVSTDTAAALDIPITSEALVLAAGGARTTRPLTHAVDVVDTSEIERYTRCP